MLEPNRVRPWAVAWRRLRLREPSDARGVCKRGRRSTASVWSRSRVSTRFRPFALKYLNYLLIRVRSYFSVTKFDSRHVIASAVLG